MFRIPTDPRISEPSCCEPATVLQILIFSREISGTPALDQCFPFPQPVGDRWAPPEFELLKGNLVLIPTAANWLLGSRAELQFNIGVRSCFSSYGVLGHRWWSLRAQCCKPRTLLSSPMVSNVLVCRAPGTWSTGFHHIVALSCALSPRKSNKPGFCLVHWDCTSHSLL